MFMMRRRDLFDEFGIFVEKIETKFDFVIRPAFTRVLSPTLFNGSRNLFLFFFYFSLVGCYEF